MAPPEIPRVQMQTGDNLARVTIALNRADFFVSSANSELSPAQAETFFKDVNLISEILLVSTGVTRLGLVGRIYRDSKEPADEIASTMLRKKYENLQDTSVKIVERHVVDRFTFNDSFQFDNGTKLDTQQKILVITRDLNTAPDVPLNVNMEIVKEFSLVSRARLDAKYIDAAMGVKNGDE